MYTKKELLDKWWFIKKDRKIFFIDKNKKIKEIELHDELIESLNKWYKISLLDWEIQILETDKAREIKVEELKEKTKAHIYSKYNREDQTTLWMRALKIVSKVLKWETLTTEDEESQKEAEDMEIFISSEIEKYHQEKKLILNINNDWNNI